MPARTWRVRQLRPDDLDAVAALEEEAHAPHGLAEGPAALLARSAASPSTCFVVEGGGHPGGHPAAYLLALPYPFGQSPHLGRTERYVHHSRNLHLHDLVVAARFRGRGLARALLQRLEESARAKGCERISLVAVAGSETFWTARGYVPHREIPLHEDYGAHAVYMSAPVRHPPHATPRTARAV
ncbi:GNAT family N-acetyltransferase [Streptomyces sp. NPDC001674]|uniref:GNAT family N-acetyltransferase n=1 Tax=Streptomyces sp. NPDC001674 TaxID=3154394 RepID=UPI00331B6834